MKKIPTICLLICFLAASCSPKMGVSTASPSTTPLPRETETPAVTALPTRTTTPTRNFTLWPAWTPRPPTATPIPPYTPKKIIFNYTVFGQHTYFDDYIAEMAGMPILIIYEDGQMVGEGGQKILSPQEIAEFISILDEYDFFTLESNQQDDPTDKLYDFGSNYQKGSGGLDYCVIVNSERSRTLCAKNFYMQYLIPKMKALFKYLDHYQPSGMTPFDSDRSLISIQCLDPRDGTLDPNASPWDDRLPPLAFSSTKEFHREYFSSDVQIMYLDGDLETAVEDFLNNAPTDHFIENGKEYVVQMDTLLPHETVVNFNN